MISASVDPGLVRKIAVLCKDYHVIRTIGDLFLFAGAEPSWQGEPDQSHGSQRMDEVYGWVEGLRIHAPERLDQILQGVAIQLIEDEEIPEGDRNFLRRRLQFGEKAVTSSEATAMDAPRFPQQVEKLLERLIQGLPRAMFPLKHRRKGLPALHFDNEYDLQALFHALVRPWIKDIRTEEYTPSYAGGSTRVDFLLADYGLVVEMKFVRDSRHGKTVGNELVLDIGHYRVHPRCDALWAVVFDPGGFIENPDGLRNDLDGEHSDANGDVTVRTFMLSR